MIPKVATSLFHHTSRAVAAVQNGTGQYILNALQSQPGNASSGSLGSWTGATSSSGWGGSAGGAGGAKYHAGSKFYSGYTGPGRAITQANSTSNSSNTVGQDDEDTPNWKFTSSTKRAGPRSRRRSSSLSLGQGRDERGESLGVLKTVQMHARMRHAFARRQETLAVEDETASSTTSPRRILVRRNSTSAHVPSDELPLDFAPATAPVSPKLHPTDPAAPQTAAPPTEEELNAGDPFYDELRAASLARDNERVTTMVEQVRASPLSTFKSYNMALDALHHTRPAGQPLNFMLETYNEMLSRNMIPNIRTYIILIHALTDRDKEVAKVITMLATRMKRRKLGGREEMAVQSADAARIADLKKEVNFNSAMALFRVASSLRRGNELLPPIYNELLKSAAYHGDVDAAITIFTHLEKRTDIQPTITNYGSLISCYSAAGDLLGSKEVFAEYRKVAGTISEQPSKDSPENTIDIVGDHVRTGSARTAQLNIWNKLIEAHFRNRDPMGALNILEEMLASDATPTYGPTEVPRPATSTFTIIIGGFCRAGDTESALKWFNLLLTKSKPPRTAWETTSEPTRPDVVCWGLMMDHLASVRNLPELNRLFAALVRFSDIDSIYVRLVDRQMVLDANIAELTNEEIKPAKEVVEERIRFLMGTVMGLSGPESKNYKLHHNYYEALVEICLSYDLQQLAMDIIEPHVYFELERLKDMEDADKSTSDLAIAVRRSMGGWLTMISMPLIGMGSADGSIAPSTADFTIAMRIGVLKLHFGSVPTDITAPYFLDAYYTAQAAGTLETFPSQYWDLLILSAAALIQPRSTDQPKPYARVPTRSGFSNDSIPSSPPTVRPNIVALLKEMAKSVDDISVLSNLTRTRLVQAVAKELGSEEKTIELFSKDLPSSYQHYFRMVGLEAIRRAQQHAAVEGISLGTVDAADHPEVTIDTNHSRFIEEFYPTNPRVPPEMAYDRFIAGIKNKLYPAPETIARLIGAIGRQGDLQKVHYLYDVGQAVLKSIEHDKKWQSNAWFYVEDQMIIALVHCGQMDGALVHRDRIIQQGGTPSADAYGALVQGVKDTTDDPVYALDLFHESQSRGNASNLYLYNNIISKLAKARKADMALDLFTQMKAENIRPSSVTYGAVIAACCRVGDAQSAEMLFLEMSSQPNFKPRVPPYNTMIQLYTHTKPNRERALYYYQTMLSQAVRPTDHTYKLLLDIFGSLEPINITAMEEVFQQLVNDRYVAVYGTHWAALINAWGCIQKDLQKACGIFESIASHPTTRKARIALPDAVAYEAIFNVFTMHRRADLLTQYRERLAKSDVHMTAYIANLLIKGYAACGDLNEARAIFESMLDPPTGKAAVHNHAPHDAENTPTVPASAPVYREPSTWEAMIRAELGSHNRDAAIALIERMATRNFPLAVVHRIKGIMLDDSVSPWASPAEPTPTDSGYGSPPPSTPSA